MWMPFHESAQWLWVVVVEGGNYLQFISKRTRLGDHTWFVQDRPAKRVRRRTRIQASRVLVPVFSRSYRFTSCLWALLLGRVTLRNPLRLVSSCRAQAEPAWEPAHAAGQEWSLETSSDLSGLLSQWGHSGDPRRDQILRYI